MIRWLHEKDFDKAIVDFTNVIHINKQINPDFNRIDLAFRYRGTAYFLKEHFLDAEKNLSVFFNLDKENVNNHILRNIALARMNRLNNPKLNDFRDIFDKKIIVDQFRY